MDISVRKESFGGDDQSWLGSAHGTSSGRTVTLDKSKFTAGTHYPEGFVRGGTPIARITATGLYGPYTPADTTTGLGTLAGFVLTPVPAVTGGGNALGGVLYEHGPVIEANLPIAIDADGKTDVAGRIWFR